MALFTNIWDSLRSWWQSAPPATRALATGLALLLVAGLAVAGSLATSPDYQAIYHGVSGKDASAIEAVLREHSIAMHFDDKAGTISVPSKDESNATMYIEAAGILSKDSNIVGIESLKSLGFGLTSENENRQILAANEGELARKLMRLDPVESAAVSIALPSSSTFVGNETPPTASVILTLKSGESLSSLQVKGMVNLVAHSVTGLTAQNVTLTDQTGVPLWKDNGAGGNSLGDGQPGDENAKASEMERKKLQSVLDQAFGPGKAIITVNAELNLDQTSLDLTEHIPVPGTKNGLKISTKTEEETYSGVNGGSPPVGGVTGGAANLNAPSYPTGAAGAGAGGGGGKYDKTATVENYVPNDKHTITQVAPGGVKKMSVAALVDASVPAENIPKIKDVISTAIGAVPGDNTRFVSVQQIAFDQSAQKAQATQVQSVMSQQLWTNIARALAVCVVAVVLLFLLTRGGMRSSGPQLAHAGGGANIGLLHSMPETDMAAFSDRGSDRMSEHHLEERPLTVEDVLAEMPEAESYRPRRKVRAPSIEEQQDLKMESIQTMINAHPESVALLIKGWMAEDTKGF